MVATKADRKITQILLFALVIHLLLMKAVMDVYLSSPLETGMKLVKSTHNPPAKRVVLFVSDGLRAQALYDEDEKQAPYLSSIRRSKGSWGVSYTRVPTESRPGHVAMLGGIYEDPSAVFQGWQKNPVEFDSVINESTNAWCWGSPDIVPMFTSGRPFGVHAFTYDPDKIDFADSDPSVLDTWVLKEVQAFFKEKRRCETCLDLHQAGNVFFFHLLGVDTAGHAFKPFSSQYSRNIHVVDDIIAQLEKTVDEFFEDDLTAYVFTSDHGMTNWGSHGSGLDVETNTPIIVWGPGVKRDATRLDIKQVDIAPLLSALVGNNYPINSLGKLPYKYLDIPEQHLAEMYFNNAKQLFQIYDVKRKKVAKNSLFYKPFILKSGNELSISEETFVEIFMEGEYNMIIRLCDKLIEDILEGIDYYQNYYMFNILSFTSVGFIGWMIYLCVFLTDVDRSNLYRCHYDVKFCNLFFSLLGLTMITVCFCQSHPLMYHFYYTFPLLTWYFVVKENGKIFYILTLLCKYELKWKILETILYMACVFLLIWGFYQRLVFTYVMWLTSSWVFISDIFKSTTVNRRTTWFSLCLVISVFPALPEMSTTFHTPLYLTGCFLWAIVMHYVVDRKIKKLLNQDPYQNLQFVCLKGGFYSGAFFALLVAESVIDADSSLKYFSWIIFWFPIVTLLFHSKSIPLRIPAVFMAFAPFYMMTSTTYEVIFMAAYTYLLGLWLLIETRSTVDNLATYEFGKTYQKTPSTALNNMRMSLIFMTFILVGFFGTGNIASLNSFDPMWVRCFLTVYNPFAMTLLIVLKLVIPFIFTTVVFRGIITATGANVTKLFCGILLYSDIMVLFFMFSIKNVGSWLDIGISISHFLIMEAFVFIIILLYLFVYLLTNLSYRTTYFKYKNIKTKA